jgi:hypothetical protein
MAQWREAALKADKLRFRSWGFTFFQGPILGLEASVGQNGHGRSQVAVTDEP